MIQRLHKGRTTVRWRKKDVPKYFGKIGYYLVLRHCSPLFFLVYWVGFPGISFHRGQCPVASVTVVVVLTRCRLSSTHKNMTKRMCVTSVGAVVSCVGLTRNLRSCATFFWVGYSSLPSCSQWCRRRPGGTFYRWRQSTLSLTHENGSLMNNVPEIPF